MNEYVSEWVLMYEVLKQQFNLGFVCDINIYVLIQMYIYSTQSNTTDLKIAL
jgi:hypothetical protein